MGLLDRDLWNEVFSTLTKNVLRTLLTTLGVIFAMLILILLLGATTGMTNGFNKLFAGTATNSIFMWSSSTSIPYQGFERGRPIQLTLDDVDLLQHQVPEIEVVAPRIQLGDYRTTVAVIRNGKTSGSSVYGDYPNINLISKKKMTEGRFLNQNDMDDKRKVCVIGLDAYKLLFEKGENALGKEIKINGIYFSVIGIYQKNDKINFEGENAIFVPFSTFQASFNSANNIGWMSILIKPNQKVADAETKIKTFLKKKHHVHPDDTRAFGSFNFAEMYEGINAFTFVLQGFAFFVGMFTLLAGVIAVSNILLITVKERTNEIGIRRALGATPAMIKKQIILESIVLTFFAGLVGFILSIAALHLLDYLLQDTQDIPFINPTVSIPQVLISFVLMVGLSILIGLIPANKAIKIKPIDALREE